MGACRMSPANTPVLSFRARLDARVARGRDEPEATEDLVPVLVEVGEARLDDLYPRPVTAAVTAASQVATNLLRKAHPPTPFAPFPDAAPRQIAEGLPDPSVDPRPGAAASSGVPRENSVRGGTPRSASRRTGLREERSASQPIARAHGSS